uniref:Uncharacterized protein n=1 Tax=Amphimedon queenslandica TaxID=400682 RepID=A0A1X7T7N8_AMPQE
LINPSYICCTVCSESNIFRFNASSTIPSCCVKIVLQRWLPLGKLVFIMKYSVLLIPLLL